MYNVFVWWTSCILGGRATILGNRKQGSVEIALGGHGFENSQTSPGPFLALLDRNLRCLNVLFSTNYENVRTWNSIK